VDRVELLESIGRRCGVPYRTLGVEVATIVPVVAKRPCPPLVVAVGECTRVRLAPPQIFHPALWCRAEGVVLVHNHPDGAPPSLADRAVTRRLVAAGAVMGIPLLGHLVITEGAWVECTG
jgi:proteasome lid subunit RPN8/RPN11